MCVCVGMVNRVGFRSATFGAMPVPDLTFVRSPDQVFGNRLTSRREDCRLANFPFEDIRWQK